MKTRIISLTILTIALIIVGRLIFPNINDFDLTRFWHFCIFASYIVLIIAFEYNIWKWAYGKDKLREVLEEIQIMDSFYDIERSWMLLPPRARTRKNIEKDNITGENRAYQLLVSEKELTEDIIHSLSPAFKKHKVKAMARVMQYMDSIKDDKERLESAKKISKDLVQPYIDKFNEKELKSLESAGAVELFEAWNKSKDNDLIKEKFYEEVKNFDFIEVALDKMSQYSYVSNERKDLDVLLTVGLSRHVHTFDKEDIEQLLLQTPLKSNARYILTYRIWELYVQSGEDIGCEVELIPCFYCEKLEECLFAGKEYCPE